MHQLVKDKTTTKSTTIRSCFKDYLMARVRFNLRPNGTKDPYIQLIYRINGDNKKLVIGTKLNVPTEYWNKRTMRVRETKDYPEFALYNSYLNKWEESVNTAMSKYLLDNTTPSKLQLKKDILSIMKGGKSSRDKATFSEYFDQFIEKRKLTQVTAGTIRVYENARNHVERFRTRQLHGVSLEFQDLDKDFFIRFISYLSHSLERNTINKIIKRIRTVLHEAEEDGIKVNDDYKLKHSQISYRRQPKIYLSLSEIEEINKVELESHSRLDRVRDLLLIGLWTGLRYSDMSRVNASHISRLAGGKRIIKIRAVKTKQFVMIPMKEIIQNIFDKYEGDPPSLSEQKFNQYLKELCELAGLDTPVYRIEKDKQVRYKKFEVVSSHICRRSFATNSFKSGIHPKYIMAITGHKTMRQFMDYICIDDEESVELVSDNPFFD